MSFHQKKKVYELALLSFTQQTYGAKGASRILNNMKQTSAFDLIDRIKEKVYDIKVNKYDGRISYSPLKHKMESPEKYEQEEISLGSSNSSLSKSLCQMNINIDEEEEEKFPDIICT